MATTTFSAGESEKRAMRRAAERDTIRDEENIFLERSERERAQVFQELSRSTE